MTDLIDLVIPEDQQEGTELELGKWLKDVGDAVKQHEPVAELVTDKAVVEIPAPADGVLREQLVAPETEVSVGQVIGRIEPGATGDAPATTPTEDVVGHDDETVDLRAHAARRGASTDRTGRPPAHPAVARFAAARGVDLQSVDGTGKDGRVTRADVLSALGESAPAASAPAAAPARARPPMPPISGPSHKVPHDPMRRTIARRMTDSVLTAPHVTAAFPCDLSKVAADREQRKAALAEQGIKLTYTAYFVQAAVAGIREVPEINSRWHDDGLEIFESVHVGVGTALEDKGLVVPVLKDAQDLDLEGTARALTELTDRARSGQLQAADMKGSTFSISNHGMMGSLFACPIIINQPESAILGLGRIEKRAVVDTVDGSDSIVIRPMLYVTLTIDHRVLDAFHCNRFLSAFVETIETWGE
jgi:2-oxoglutarate dehydrogenase E2 component (dihydrolipoamide succinyltransferase)